MERQILTRIITKILCAFAFVMALASSPANAQFAQQATWGGEGGGTANAQTVTVANVQSLSDILGVAINYIPSNANTGATTEAVSGLSAVALLKPSPAGLVPLTGGELSGGGATILYDGTEFQLLSPNPVTTVPPHAIMAFNLSACPAGWLASNGSSGTLNLVGYFLRGLDTAGVVDPNPRTLGSIEAFAMQNFYVNTTIPAASTSPQPAGNSTGAVPHYVNTTYSSTGPISAATNTPANTDLETRPVNVAVRYCEKQ